MLQRPKDAVALFVVALVVWSAHRSVAWPVGLASVPAVLVAVLGHNPLPSKGATIGIAAWTILAVAFAVGRGVVVPTRVLASIPVLATIGLAVLLIARLGASEVPWYGSTKVQLFIALDVLALLGGIFVGRERRTFLILVTLWIVLAAITAAALARGLATGQAQAYVGGRFSIDQQNGPIGLARDAARGILVAIALLLSGRGGWRQLLAFATLPLIAVAFMASGSRGPVVGLVLGLLVLLALTLRDPRARWRVWLVGVGIVVAAMLVTQLVPGQDVQRALSVLTGSGGGHSSNGRSALWSAAASLFASHPLLGVGTGSFALYRPPELYPHNLFLEVAAELGVVGLLLVIAVVVGGGWMVWRVYRLATDEDRPTVALVAALFVSAVVNAQFSGDITTNNDVWLVLGLAIGMTLRYGQRVGEPVSLRIRPWRRDAPVRRPRAAREPGQRRTPWLQTAVTTGRRHPGEIVVPAEGAIVGAAVDVGGRPAETGWGVASVQLEFSADGGRTWRLVPHGAGEAVDLFRVVGGFREHVAVTRTRRVAELLADELDRLDDAADRYDLVPSLRRPWQLGAGWSIEWDTGDLEDGDYVLRAVTLDVAGSRVSTPLRHVRVDAAAAAEARAAAPVPGAAELARARALVERTRADVESRERHVQGEEQRLSALRTEVERLRAEVQAGRADLETRVAAASARAAELEQQAAALEQARAEVAGLEATRTELDQARAELDAQRAELTALRSDVEAREVAVADLEERAAAVTAAEQQLADREGALERRLAEVTRREVDQARAHAELARVEQERAELQQLRATLDAQRSEQAVRGAELAAREKAVADVEERAAAVAAAEQQLTVRERALERRVAEVTRREVDQARAHADLVRLEPERAALEAQRRELVERSAALDEREASVASVEARADEVAAAVAEISAREAQVARRLEAVTAREADAARRQAAIDAKVREIESREAALADVAAETGRLTALRVDADARVQRAEQETAKARTLAAELAAREEAASTREAELATRVEVLTQRERELARRVAETAERERRVTERDRELEAQLATLQATGDALAARTATVPPATVPVAPAPPVAEPLPESAPAPVAPLAPAPRPEPVPAQPRVATPPPLVAAPAPSLTGRLRLERLERLVVEQPHPDPYVQEERRALLFQLRTYAEADGSIPEQFMPMLRDVFGDVGGGS